MSISTATKKNLKAGTFLLLDVENDEIMTVCESYEEAEKELKKRIIEDDLTVSECVVVGVAGVYHPSVSICLEVQI